MKREELTALGLSEEQITGVLTLHNTDSTNWQDRFNSQQSQLQQYEGVDVNALKKQVTDLQEQLTNKDRTFAMENFFRDVEFSSGLAKKACMADFEAKKFERKDGKYTGADAWLEELKKPGKPFGAFQGYRISFAFSIDQIWNEACAGCRFFA